MANTITLTNITELLYQARDIVSREMVGVIPGVTINSGSQRVSLNGTVKSIVTEQPTLNTTHTPSMTIPQSDDTSIGVEEMSVGQVARTTIPLKGETLKQLDNTAGRQVVMKDLLAQHIRVMVNAIEAHTAGVIYKGASRATGTAGTNPFATNHHPIIDLHQILKDNGCPQDGQVSLAINTTAGSAFRKLTNLYQVNEAGDGGALLRRGVLTDIDGMMIRESAGIFSHVKGAGTGYDIDLAEGFGLGDTVLHLDGGTVNTTGVKAGDVVTFASDAINKYIVRTGTTDAEADIVLNNPGLRAALADAVEMTIGNSYTANIGWHRSAVELVMRPAAMPEGGDAAVDRMMVVDDESGLVFEVALYKGYGMNMLEFLVYYQAKVWKSEFAAVLLG